MSLLSCSFQDFLFEGWGEKAYNHNWITIKIKKKHFLFVFTFQHFYYVLSRLNLLELILELIKLLRCIDKCFSSNLVCFSHYFFKYYFYSFCSPLSLWVFIMCIMCMLMSLSVSQFSEALFIFLPFSFCA